MSERPEPLRYVSWKDLFPWLLLFRTFSLSIAVSTLLLATLAVTAIPVGWRFGGLLFLSDEERATHAEVVGRLERMPGQPAQLLRTAPRDATTPRGIAGGIAAPRDTAAGRSATPVPAGAGADAATVSVADSGRPDLRIQEALRLSAATLSALTRPGVGVPVRAYLVFGCLTTLLVYSLAGGAVTRLAVLRLGRDERIGVGAACSHARRRWLAYLLAPLYPLLAVLLIFFSCALLGLLMRVGVGAVVAAALWPLALLGAAIGALLLMGVVAGGPLMWGATSSEPDGDVFEAISRSYSYVMGRPLNLIGYAALAAAIGSVGWIAVVYFCELTVGLASGGAQWGAGEASGGVFDAAPAGLSWFASLLIQCGNGAVGALRRGFEFSYFWTAVGGIYLLIRRDVDNTEIDEVHSEEQGERFTLPALKIDASGVPQVDRASPETETASAASAALATGSEAPAEVAEVDDEPPRAPPAVSRDTSNSTSISDSGDSSDSGAIDAAAESPPGERDADDGPPELI